MYSACAPETADRFLNNKRARGRIVTEFVEFVAISATVAEEVDDELGAWFTAPRTCAPRSIG